MKNAIWKTIGAAFVLSIGALTAPAYAECDLCTLAQKGNLGAIQELWEMQNPDDPTAPIIDIDGADHRNRTAIFFAARKGHGEVVDFLIDQGADATIASKVGRTPLMNAAEGGHNFILLAIYDNAYYDNPDADIDAVLTSKGENRGKTAWDLAVDNGHTGAGLLLINRNATPSFGVSTFAYAREVLNADLSHALMNGRTVDTPFGGENAVLLYAAENGDTDLFDALVADGAMLTVTNDDGETIGDIALQNDDSDLLSEIVEIPGAPVPQCEYGEFDAATLECSDPRIEACELSGGYWQDRCITGPEIACTESDGNWDGDAKMCDCPGGTSLIGLHCLSNCGENEHRVDGNTACVCLDGYELLDGVCVPEEECPNGGHYVNEQFGCFIVSDGNLFWKVRADWLEQSKIPYSHKDPTAVGFTRAYLDSEGTFTQAHLANTNSIKKLGLSMAFRASGWLSGREPSMRFILMLVEGGSIPAEWNFHLYTSGSQGERYNPFGAAFIGGGYLYPRFIDGIEPVVRYFLNNHPGVDVNGVGTGRGAPLRYAIDLQMLDMIQLLRENGALCHEQNADGFSPWTRMMGVGSQEIRDWMQAEGNCEEAPPEALPSQVCTTEFVGNLQSDGTIVVEEVETCETPEPAIVDDEPIQYPNPDDVLRALESELGL